jgi:DNA ligase (NAD+)
MFELEIENKIREANIAYRKGEPFLTDKEFDELVDELVRLKPDSPVLKKDDVVSGSRERLLPLTMTSLNKVKSIDALNKWIETNNLKHKMLVAMPKYDGISLLKTFEHCYTSGDGHKGQISDRHYACLNSQDSPTDNNTYFIGEAIIPKSKYKDIIGHDNYNVPRNAVAGLFNNKVPVDKYLSLIDYKVYGVFDSATKGRKKTQSRICEEHNIPYVQFFNSVAIKEELLDKLYHKWSESYKIDGIVIGVDDYEYANRMGYEENENPCYQIALKLPQWQEEETTVVERITWNVSKLGLLKPVINVSPVTIGDVVVSNVNGINAKFIQTLRIRTGDKVSIIRSGDVIPRLRTINNIIIPFQEYYKNKKSYEEALCSTGSVLGGFEHEESNLIPTHCLCCGNELKMNDTDLYCDNPNCKDKNVQKVYSMLSTLGIKNCGVKVSEKLWEIMDDYLEIHFPNEPKPYPIEIVLNADKDSLYKIDGFQEKSVNKLHEQFRYIMENRVITYSKYLDAIQVAPEIGERTWKSVLKRIKYNDLLKLNDNELNTFLIAIDGISEITAKKIINGIQIMRKRNTVCNLIEDFEETNSGDSITICPTGFRFSKEETELLNKNGYSISDSLTNSTKMLVTKDANSTSSKIKKAKDKGVEIVTREKLIEKLS